MAPEASVTWDLIPTGILAMTWDATWEAYGAGLGRVRTDQHSLWSPEREYWSQPSRTQHNCKVEDLDLGMD